VDRSQYIRVRDDNGQGQEGIEVSVKLKIMLMALLVATSTVAEEKVGKRNILFLGNSLTSGYGLNTEVAFPAVIQAKIDSLGWNFEVINAGISGETTSAGLSRMTWMLKRTVDVLVIELGANDGMRGVPLEVTRQNLQAIVERGREAYPDVQIVIAGILVPPNLGPKYTSEFKEIFPELARKNKVALIPFLLEGVGGIAELNLADGIHPTIEGHRIVAENVWNVLKPLLTDKSGSQ
jgi:acyl-CoA thioesterase-1